MIIFEGDKLKLLFFKTIKYVKASRFHFFWSVPSIANRGFDGIISTAFNA
jgi:hypothetical protein